MLQKVMKEGAEKALASLDWESLSEMGTFEDLREKSVRERNQRVRSH